MANYRKNYFCICEGQQKTMYLDHLARLLKKFPQRVVTFKHVENDVLEMKISYVEYDHAALFDYDFRKDRFKKSIEKCDKLMRDNAKKGKKKDAQKVGDSICYDNPDLSIHEFVKMVLVDCGEM